MSDSIIQTSGPSTTQSIQTNTINKTEGVLVAKSQKELPPGKSHSACPLNDANAVVALGKLLNVNNAKWSFPAGPEFSKQFIELKEKIDKGEYEKYLKSAAGKGNEGRDTVNKFLKDNGFSIKFEGNYGPDEGIAASVFKQHVDWKKPGASRPISIEDSSVPNGRTRYEGVEMSREKHAFRDQVYRTFKVAGRDVIELQTTDGSKVYLTLKANGDKNEPDATHTLAQNVTEAIRNDKAENTTSDYNKINFPKVNYSRSGALDHLVNAKSGSTTIAEALYEHHLKMDEKGASAEAASAVRGTKGMSHDLRIDGPFHVWFTDTKGNITFSATIDKDSMIKVEEKSN